MRPVVGLSTYREQARFRVWDTETDLLPTRYARSVERAGGVPVLLPPTPGAAATVVSRLDALVVCGGSDVDPARYGAPPHPQTGPPRPDRDAWELGLLGAAAAAGLPTLGVCRGMQLMAVWAGGSLVQHLPDVVGSERHSPGPDEYGPVTVRTVAGSRLQQLLGPGVEVRCHHHQGVAEAPGHTVTARSDDGTVEAMESPDRPFWVGVQWHPEQGDDLALFRGLVEATGLADGTGG